MNKKIKIIHLVSDLGIGGVQKVVLDVCSSANLEKYEVSIFMLKNETSFLPAYSISPDIEIKSFNYQYSDDYSLKGHFKCIRNEKYIKEKGRDIINETIKCKPDILHLHTHPMELGIGVLIQKQISCALVYTEHVVRLTPSSFKLNILGKIFKHVYKRYHLIAVSKTVLSELQKHKLTGKNKTLTLIENKINLVRFKPSPKKQKDFVTVVYIARIVNLKGHTELIKAWSLLPKEINKKLLIVGPDGLNNEIHLLANKLVPDGSVIFTGQRLDVANILMECDFAVLPSFKEGLPIALLEKMAMELPVVVSNIPELTSIVTDGVDGLVFKCGNVEDLAEKMLILMKDREVRLRMGKAARTTVEEKYGSANIALANEKVYERIVGYPEIN